MRDRLIHGYFDVDLDIVWRIIVDNLPPLVAALDVALASEGHGPADESPDVIE